MTDRARTSQFASDVVIVGGCGHAGLPLAVALADRGARVISYDADGHAAGTVNRGRMPFREPAADLPLRRAVAAGRLVASDDPAIVGSAECVIVVTSGPEYGADTPDLRPESIGEALAECAANLRDGQTLILRSTVAPGTTAAAEKLVAELGVDIDVAYCPERTSGGMAMTELRELPQIVASRTPGGLERASRVFAMLTPVLVPLTPEEAELAKLFTNAWRYVSFAVANQFYMIASDLGLDYERIRAGLVRDYPRAGDLAPAGFTAGPNLLTDTIWLASANPGFSLGRAAVAVNQGLPAYLIGRLEQRFDLAGLTVGVLGMAFKGGSDDTRASLSYLIADLLAGRCRSVLCSDPVVTSDQNLVPLDVVLDRADLLVIAAPHPQYRGLRTGKPVIDIWNVLRRGVLA